MFDRLHFDDTVILELQSRYSEPGRYYHGINHIKYLVAKYKEFFNSISPEESLSTDEETALYYAIVWHDAQYSIWAPQGDNEVESAYIFAQASKHNLIKYPNYVQRYVVNKMVNDAILATAKHTETQENLSRVSKIMLDLDLAAFGGTYAQVRYNTDQIELELQPLALSYGEFVELNAKFLKALLARDFIYYTEYFRTTYESVARANITRLLEDLHEECLELPDSPRHATLRTGMPVQSWSLEQAIDRQDVNKEMMTTMLRTGGVLFTHPSGLKGIAIRDAAASGGWSTYYLDGSIWTGVDAFDEAWAD